LKELQQSLTIARNILERYDVTSDEATALLLVVTNYAYALEQLDDYDHQRLTPGKGTDKPATGIVKRYHISGSTFSFGSSLQRATF